MSPDNQKKTIRRRVLNRVLHVLARSLPGSMSLRPALHRLRGMKVGSDVFIGDDVYLENEYPESVEIGDGSQIGLRSVLIAHFQGAGRVIIGKDVWIGACVFISSGNGRTLRIGDGAVIGACSVITTDVAPKAVLKPPPPERIGTAHIAMPRSKSYSHFVLGLRPERYAQEDRDKNGSNHVTK